MNINELIVEQIRKELNDRKITQKQLAEKIGITQTNMCRILKGNRKISLNNLYLIAKYLKLSVDELMRLEK